MHLNIFCILIYFAYYISHCQSIANYNKQCLHQNIRDQVVTFVTWTIAFISISFGRRAKRQLEWPPHLELLWPFKYVSQIASWWWHLIILLLSNHNFIGFVYESTHSKVDAVRSFSIIFLLVIYLLTLTEVNDTCAKDTVATDK